MNRWKRRAAAMICAAVMAAAVPAGAAEWISLSDWAYADVSSFVSSGLLPETLADVSDYTRPIKRWEFCELIYSVLDHIGMFRNDRFVRSFDDCAGYTGVNRLYSAYIISGVQTDDGTYFYPENNITREEAATIVDNAMTQLGLWTSVPYYNDNELLERLGEVINDAGTVHDNAKQSVETVIRYGVMGDTGIGSFEPKKELTVEQAVAVANRMYKGIPQLVTSDSGGITGSGEQDVKELGAGLTETYDGSVYRVKENGTELMSFEADVYSKLFTAESGGRRIVLAVNFNDKTDAYDLDTGELLYTIPYITYKIEDGHAYVYSSRFMPAYSGIYSLDGTELAAPEYSEKELDSIAENGYAVPEEEYRAADGWVYYVDLDDEREIYKTDTNGENTKKLTAGIGCDGMSYVHGMLYFYNRDNTALYCIDTNGDNLVKLGDNTEYIEPVTQLFSGTVYNDHDVSKDVYGNKLLMSPGAGSYNAPGGSFGDMVLVGERDELIREVTMNDGAVASIGEPAYILYKVSMNGGETERKQIADFRACYISGNGRSVYFLSADELEKNGESKIYVYDGVNVTTAADGASAAYFAFWYESGLLDPDLGRLCYITEDEIGEGTYHVYDMITGETKVHEFVRSESAPAEIVTNEQVSGDGVTVRRNNKAQEVIVEYNGTEKSLGDVWPFWREDELIYYRLNDGDIYGWSPSNPIRNIANTGDEIRAYNYVTGDNMIVANDYNIYWRSSDLGIYATPMMQYRLLKNGSSISIFPSKGISRYGEVRVIGKLWDVMWQPRHLYKLDTEGVMTAITDCETGDWIYVPNGVEEPAAQGA